MGRRFLTKLVLFSVAVLTAAWPAGVFATRAPNLEDFLSLTTASLPAPSTDCATADNSADPLLAFNDQNARFGAAPAICALSPGEPATQEHVRDLCQRTRLACRQANPLLGGACEINNAEVRRHRLQSARLREETREAVRGEFEKTVSDPVLARACCSPPQNATGKAKVSWNPVDCVSRLRAVKLEILETRNPEDKKAHYNTLTKTVVLSQALLTASTGLNSVMQTVNHELGHACYHARGGLKLTEALGFLGCKKQSRIDRQLNHIEATFGTDVSSCISEELERTAAEFRKKGVDVCRGNWYEEAFATMVFSHRYPGPATWNIDCEGFADEDHGPPWAVIKCMLRIPAVHANICGSHGSVVADRP